MKSFAYPLAILVVATTCMASTASAGATGDLQEGAQQIEKNMAEKKQLRSLDRHMDATEYQDIKKFVVKNAREVKRTFDLAAKQRGAQAIEISCSPADSQWCADDFVQACEDHGGGASSNPEGGVTCSLPQWD